MITPIMKKTWAKLPPQGQQSCQCKEGNNARIISAETTVQVPKLSAPRYSISRCCHPLSLVWAKIELVGTESMKKIGNPCFSCYFTAAPSCCHHAFHHHRIVATLSISTIALPSHHHCYCCAFHCRCHCHHCIAVFVHHHCNHVTVTPSIAITVLAIVLLLRLPSPPSLALSPLHLPVQTPLLLALSPLRCSCVAVTPSIAVAIVPTIIAVANAPSYLPSLLTSCQPSLPSSLLSSLRLPSPLLLSPSRHHQFAIALTITSVAVAAAATPSIAVALHRRCTFHCTAVALPLRCPSPLLRRADHCCHHHCSAAPFIVVAVVAIALPLPLPLLLPLLPSHCHCSIHCRFGYVAVAPSIAAVAS